MIPVPVGEIWDQLETTCKVHDDEERAAMRTMVNLAYYELCGLRPWQNLMRTAQITLGATDTEGALFPADVAGIYHVEDTDGNVYQPRSVSNLRSDEQIHRWYYGTPVSEPLQIGISGANIAPTSKTFSGITLTASQVGEWISFGAEMGFYLTDSTTTITRRFRSIDENGVQDGYYQVRPEGQQRVLLMDETGALSTAPTNFYYWVFPLPLTQENHLIQLPATRALEYLSAVAYWGDYKQEHEEADRWDIKYKRALSDLKAREPSFITQMVAKDVLGRRVIFGRRR